MEIETYEVTELNSVGEVENVEETKKLVEELGLEGQEKFFKQESKSIFPYRKITAKEKLVYQTICSQKTDFKKYSDGIIPLRVLQVASHALTFGDVINAVEVWHCPNGDVKDPVLVGRKGTEWSGEYYLLARWGEVLESFESLSKVAKQLIKTHVKGKLAEEKAEMEQFETSLDARIESDFSKGKLTDCSFYPS
jgi:phage terminase large subunit-like protein